MKFWLIAVPIVMSMAVGLTASAMETPQNIAIDSKLQIPGGLIDPGTYTLSIEKRLTDRLLIRIASGNTSKSHILLAIPSSKLTSPADSGKGIVLFNSSDHDRVQTLRGWLCPTCRQGLEFVYPKAEAKKITLDTAQSSLGSELGELESTPIWGLSAKHVSRSHRGTDIEAVLLVRGIRPPSSSRLKAAVKQLPRTATNSASLAVWGLLLLASALFLHTFRQHEVH